MNNIDRIIKLNRNRNRAIKERNFEKFQKFSLKIHKLEVADRVEIDSYIISNIN